MIRDKHIFKKILQNLLLLTISSLFTILLLEAILRIFKEDKYFVWNPYLRATFYPSPVLLPGIRGESLFRINSEGFRSEEIHETTDLAIVALGGSTTECIYLDQEETWTFLTQRNLSKILGKKVWIGNAGKSGMTTYEHIVQSSVLLKQYNNIDFVLILPGINDLQRRLGARDYRTRKINRDIYFRAFQRTPYYNPDLPVYKKTELWRSLGKLRYLFIDSKGILDKEGRTIEQWRQNRREAKKIINQMPDLTRSLSDYANNVNKIINICRSHNKQPVFITQPVIWYKGMPPVLENLCWFGGVGDYQNEKEKEYFSIEIMERGMKLYNEKLREICRERNVFLIDLEDKLPKDKTVYYDDCHFNENGSRIVAELVTAGLVEILKPHKFAGIQQEKD